jgi:hypothetical protein
MRTLKTTNKLKTSYAVCLGLLINPFLTFVQKYIFADLDFIIFVGLIILLDTILGVWKGLKYNKFSSFRFYDVVEKVVLYGFFLVFVHIGTHFRGGTSWLSGWLDNIGYTIVIVREGISLIENIGAIRPQLLPKWLLSKLKDFDEKGELILSNNESSPS